MPDDPAPQSAFSAWSASGGGVDARPLDIGYGAWLHLTPAPTGAGQRSPIVLACPGFTQTPAAFEGPSSSLSEVLSHAGLRTALLELPRPRAPARHRESPLWPGLASYAEAVAPRALSLLQRRHPEAPLIWLGHSMGGIIGAAMPPACSAGLAAMVVLGSPLLPGTLPPWARRWGLSALRPFLQGSARARERRGEAFPGAAFGRALLATQPLWDRAFGQHPWPWQVWAPGALPGDERRHALETSFVDDRWGVLADLLELGLSDGERAGTLPVGERIRALTPPLLVVGGDYDGLAPLSSTRPFYERAGSETKEFLEMGVATTGRAFGHIDLVLGERAKAQVWPRVVAFLRRVLPRHGDDARAPPS